MAENREDVSEDLGEIWSTDQPLKKSQHPEGKQPGLVGVTSPNSCCRKLKSHFEEYCAKSSLHGLQYIGDHQTPIVERVIWIVAVTCSMLTGCYLIGQVYNKWETAPVIVSLATSETPIRNIPFPAVTVCDMTKVRTSLFNWTDVEERLKRNASLVTPEELTHLEATSLVCTHYYDGFAENRSASDTCLRTMLELGRGYEMIQYSEWNEKESLNITRSFKPIITQDGVCYTFNLLDTAQFYTDVVQVDPAFKSSEPAQWSLSSFYDADAEMDTYPRRALFSGAEFGLGIFLKSLAEEHDHMCRFRPQGFKVMLHNSAQLPGVNNQFVLSEINRELNIAVTPAMIVTSDTLKNYSPARRNCHFPADRQLRFYREYTQRKCNFECLTNYTYRACKCVAFYMPRSKGMKICGPARKDCIKKAKLRLISKSVAELLEDDDQKEVDDDDEVPEDDVPCDCLPACTELTYNTEVTSRSVDIENLRKVDPEFTNTTSLTVVRIYLKIDQFTASHRSELFGITEFIAYSGGLLGLFLGFSILSLLEIVYFSSVRAIRTFRRREE